VVVNTKAELKYLIKAFGEQCVIRTGMIKTQGWRANSWDTAEAVKPWVVPTMVEGVVQCGLTRSCALEMRNLSQTAGAVGLGEQAVPTVEMRPFNAT
jgi:hypothetical protein